MERKRSANPAVRKAAGAPSPPADIAAALVGAPSKAILFVWRTIFTATQPLLGANARIRMAMFLTCPLSGRQFWRQREANVFANQIEVTMIRKTKAGKPLADLFNQNFWRRGARGKAQGLYTIEPGSIDIVGVFDQTRRDTGANRHFYQAIGIGAVR